jgi:hypothetical protein
MCNKSIICGVLFASGTITFYPKVFYAMHYFWSIICPLEVRWLTPLSTIFQSPLLWRKLEYPEKSISVASHWQTLSHNVLSSTPRHEWGPSKSIEWTPTKNILSANQLFSLIDMKRKFINSDNHKFHQYQ